MSQTINIKDIPGHVVDTAFICLDAAFPYLLQFNFHFSDSTHIDFHSRTYPTSDSNCHIVTWKVKQLH